MNFIFLGRIIDRAMRTLYMAEAEDFARIFGEGGPHLWNKFCGYDKEISEFICSLDHGNLEKLARAAANDLAEDEAAK